MTRTKVADQRFSLKQWFAGGAQSRGLRKPGCGHCYLRFFQSTAFSRDVTEAMLVSPTNPPGIELDYHANVFLCFDVKTRLLTT